jgi:hypothetical protein
VGSSPIVSTRLIRTFILGRSAQSWHQPGEGRIWGAFGDLTTLSAVAGHNLTVIERDVAREASLRVRRSTQLPASRLLEGSSLFGAPTSSGAVLLDRRLVEDRRLIRGPRLTNG